MISPLFLPKYLYLIFMYNLNYLVTSYMVSFWFRSRYIYNHPHSKVNIMVQIIESGGPKNERPPKRPLLLRLPSFLIKSTHLTSYLSRSSRPNWVETPWKFMWYHDEGCQSTEAIVGGLYTSTTAPQEDGGYTMYYGRRRPPPPMNARSFLEKCREQPCARCFPFHTILAHTIRPRWLSVLHKINRPK